MNIRGLSGVIFAHLIWMLAFWRVEDDRASILVLVAVLTAGALALRHVGALAASVSFTSIFLIAELYTGDEVDTQLVFGVLIASLAVASVGLRSDAGPSTTPQEATQTDGEVERQRLSSLINSMADAVIATNQSGDVIMYNAAALSLLNVNASLEGQQLRNFMHLVDEKHKKVDIFNKADKSRAFFVTRDLSLKVDEEFVNAYVSIAPVGMSYGSAQEKGYIILLRDITHEKSLEEERDEFISVVSHELRTPVTIAEGSISNVKLIMEREGTSNSLVDDSLESAHKQVVFLADLIGDLSTLSRAERGVLQVDAETIDVHELVRSLKRDYTTEAQQVGLTFKTRVAKEVDTIVSARLYVREILQNFITNAIKYTEEGSVTLKVDKHGDAVRFTIQDTGIGLSRADQKRLFQKFFRSEDYRTRQKNGTGLGLYVTLKLARLIKGDIEVDSELNKGSEFHLTVPNLKLSERAQKS